MPDAKIIDGKAFAQDLRNRIAAEVSQLQAGNRVVPGLAVVLVGEDPASEVYVRNKVKQTKEVGMKSFEHRLDADITEDQLLTLIGGLNRNEDVHGILVQLPLPDHISAEAVIQAINPDKDVDGFHVVNSGRLAIASSDAMVPCTPLGCLMMLKDTFKAMGDDGLAGKRALVLGRSNIVGKPMAQLLLQESCTVTIAHSRTADLAEECRRADILVAAVGRPKMVPGDRVKPGAVVVDVGINRIDAPEKCEGKTRLVGDVDFEEAVKVAGAITPVPGGVGPMTIACLLRNTLVATCRQRGIDVPDI